MDFNRPDFKSLLRDESGLEAVEWLLLLGLAIVPLIALMLKIVNMTAQFYAVTSWTISLPFP